jgi:hypothetical protein
MPGVLLTVVLIFLLAFLMRNSQNNSALNELERLKSDNPDSESDYSSPANRTFENTNPAGGKVTWLFNDDATKVTIKAGAFGINSVNTTISIERMGYGRYKNSKGDIFIVYENYIQSGHVKLFEIKDVNTKFDYKPEPILPVSKEDLSNDQFEKTILSEDLNDDKQGRIFNDINDSKNKNYIFFFLGILIIGLFILLLIRKNNYQNENFQINLDSAHQTKDTSIGFNSMIETRSIDTTSNLQYSETTNNDESIQNNDEFLEQKLLNILNEYYTDISLDRFLANKYFSKNVIQFINMINISSNDIDEVFAKNNEFSHPKVSIVNDEINFSRSDGQIDFYNYWINYSCYRKSKNKFQRCNVQIEIGFDNYNKIKSYRELKVTNLNFYDN